jgi:hypothetical protein
MLGRFTGLPLIEPPITDTRPVCCRSLLHSTLSFPELPPEAVNKLRPLLITPHPHTQEDCCTNATEAQARLQPPPAVSDPV